MISELVYTPPLNGIFGLFLAMVYVLLCERILFKLRMVYIPVTEQTSLVYIPLWIDSSNSICTML